LLFFSCFSLGNFFGILIKSSIHQIQYLIGILLVSELISYISVKFKDSRTSYYLNICKRGFLIGIFVEAFKVGS
jgi:hypothetical protein